MVLITPVPGHCYLLSFSQTVFLQICLFIYLISSVFVVLCLESFGASMMYFQSWFLSQVTGNLSRESDCIRLNFKTFLALICLSHLIL